jgi:hypothetical protein
MINGNLYDWESIEIQLPQGITVGMTEISYSDERGVEPRYGKGSVPRGYGLKNYKASGSGTLDKDEYEALRVALGGSLYTKTPWIIVASYANFDQATITDTLRGVQVTKQELSAKQEDDNTGQVKIEFVVLEPIEWNGGAAYQEGRQGSLGN